MRFRIMLFIVLVTVLISLPRFAHRTPDSSRYIKVAKFLCGEMEKEELAVPFACRIFTPLLANLVPIDNLDVSFALVNILATVFAYLLFVPYLKNFLKSETELRFGIFVLVVSFPTFNYASGVLTDPLGFLFLIISAYFLLKERFLFLSASITLGIVARDALISMVMIAIIYILTGLIGKGKEIRKEIWGKLLVVTIPPMAVYIVLRIYFSGLHDAFTWIPSFRILLRNFTREISLTTFSLTLCPLLFLFLFGVWARKGDFKRSLTEGQARLLFSITIVSIIFILYSQFTVYMSGRFVWPLYTALVPLTVLSIRHTVMFRKFLAPLSDLFFGLYKKGTIEKKS